MAKHVQVANLSGFHLKKGNEYEHEFIGRIVQEVSSKLNHAPLYDEDYLVGLKSQREEVYSLLELGSVGVLLVGIQGIGGIGKSALTRIIYNRIAGQFEGSCFLDSVRGNSEKYGLVHLQSMLLSQLVGEKDIQLGNVNKGVSMIKHGLHQKKVLLVLDDVDKLEQLEALVGGLDWFGSGSRVIITTQDKHLLIFHRVGRIYEVQALSYPDALELLRHYVFRQGNVDPSYAEILNKVVAFSSGLPLTLKVIGSYMFGKSVDQCRYSVDHLKIISHNDIQKIFRVSFDTLGKDEQSVFLDIACCFKGYKLTEIEDILRAHRGYEVKYHIEGLIVKSLISISSDGKVTLHPLIEDMGKEIVRWESLTEPGKRSRLWHRKDILQVLKNNTGTSKIEIIHLDSPLIEDKEVIEWDGEAFKNMENLRTLIIRKFHFSKAPKHLPDSLRVLEWWRYSSSVLPSDFEPTKLSVCKASISSFPWSFIFKIIHLIIASFSFFQKFII